MGSVGGVISSGIGISPPILELDEVSGRLPVVLAIRSLEKYLYISPAHEKLYGRPPDEFFADVNALLKLVHPEDQDMPGLVREDSPPACRISASRMLLPEWPVIIL